MASGSDSHTFHAQLSFPAVSPVQKKTAWAINIPLLKDWRLHPQFIHHRQEILAKLSHIIKGGKGRLSLQIAT